MNDFLAITPAVHLTDERKKRGEPLPLQVRRHRLFMLWARVNGIPLRPRPAEGTIQSSNNRFTRKCLYGHTYIL